MAKKKVVVGFIDHPDRFLEVGEKARKLGFKKLNAIMPFAVHGFEKALGIKKSWIPKAAKTMLVIGAGLGFLLQAWTSAADWPINVGGKPLISWPAFIPIVFESGVLLAGITTFLALLHIGRFYPYKDPKVIRERLTDDQFALLIPLEENGGQDKIMEFFKENDIDDTEIVEM